MNEGKAPDDTSADEGASLQESKGEFSPEALDADIPNEIEAEDVGPEQAIALLEAKSHSGPLPSPEVLAKYKEISPRAVDWIFETAKKEQEHRHWCDREPLRQSRRGQNFAVALAALVIVIGGVLVYYEKAAEGLATILVPLAAILGIFVYKEVKSARVSKKPDSQETSSEDSNN